METNFNFKSQICTTREQSERLLSLGLKKETADIVHYFSQSLAQDWTIVPLADGETAKHIQGLEIPAWSLHRMWELICNRKKYESKEGDEYPKIYLNDDCVIVENPKSIWARHNFCSLRGVYENVINCIEWLIKEGYFNKEYLV